MASITVSKTVHAGSNPASPALNEKTGIQIITGVSVFFVIKIFCCKCLFWFKKVHFETFKLG